MARILKRPMFRTGGSTNEGIMHGIVDRRGYSQGPSWEEVMAKSPSIGKYYDAMSAIEQPRDTSLSQMLIQGGLNLVSGEGAGGGTLSNIAKSYRGPSETYMEAQMLRKQRDAKMKEAAVQAGLGEDFAIKQALAKRKTDVSKIQQLANDLQRNNPDQYPNTPEGNAAAFNEALRLTETSPGRPLKDQWLDSYNKSMLDPMTDPSVAENRADWVVYIRPNIPPNKRGGSVPTTTVGKGTSAIDEVNPDAMEPGLIYWDEQSGTLFEVIQNEDGSKTAREVPNWRQDYFKS